MSMEDTFHITLRALALLLGCVHFNCSADDTYWCISPQSIEMGKVGLVECVLPKTFYGIYWFNTIDVLEQGDPLVSLQRSIDGNPEYTTEGYDVSSNGSLIIQNVTLSHERTYALVVLKTQNDPPVALHIEVRVIVKPPVIFPEISNCNERICLNNVDEFPEVTCDVGISRPPISLVWKVRTLYGDEAITSGKNQTTTISFEKLISSQSVSLTTPLILLVCQMECNPFNLQYNNSLLVLQNSTMDTGSLKYKTVVFAKDEKLVLPCLFFKSGVILWQRAIRADGQYRPIAFAGTGEDIFDVVVDSGSFMETNGSLVIPCANFSHQGFYLCISSSVVYQQYQLYQAVYMIPPSTHRPIIQGCANAQKICELYFNDYTGVVTCTISDIFPKLELEIRPTSETDWERISFTSNQMTVTDHGDSYTITLESRFRITSTTTKQITIECHTVDPPFKRLYANSLVHLRFDRESENKHVDHNKNSEMNFKALFVFLSIVIVLYVLYRVARRIARNSTRNTENNDEEVPLYKPEKDKCKLFKIQLKATYENLYKSIRPRPQFIYETWHVKDLFINQQCERIRDGERGLVAYNDIISSASKRCIIEGPPGSGKTMLCIQFAYEWCSDEGAFLDVDLFLLFKSCDVQNLSSIPEAVKQLLLPKDSDITEKQIEAILNGFKSVVLFFDDYVNTSNGSTNNLIDEVMLNHIHRDMTVFVTTRSRYYLKVLVPSTDLITLNYFTKDDRYTYIDKAFARENKEDINVLKETLRVAAGEDSILNDCLEVSFFFVVIVHDAMKSGTFNIQRSATTNLKLFLSCLLHQMRNKTGDFTNMEQTDNIPYSDSFNESAFRSYLTEDIRWLSKTFYKESERGIINTYEKLGIIEYLCQNEFCFEQLHLEALQDPMKTIRKFFHEWFAAKHIESLESEALSQTLNKMNGQRFDNIFRFACGMDKSDSVTMIRHLMSHQNQNLAILCAMEIKSFNTKRQILKIICNDALENSDADDLQTEN